MTKKILIVALVLFSFATVNAFTGINPSSKSPLATEIMLPIGKGGKMISLADLATISPKQFTELSGKKLSLVEKAGLKLSQRQIRKCINADGTVNSAKLSKLSKKAEGGGFHLGGFALGFLLGLLGILIAYLLNDDLKSSRVKWAWLGFAAAILFWLLMILVVFASL